MTLAYELERKSRAGRLLWSAGIAAVVGSAGCSMELEQPEENGTLQLSTISAGPQATITLIRPVVGGTLVYEPLAPRSANHAKDAQLTIDVVVRNNQPGALDVDRIRLSYAGSVALPSVTLEDDVRKKCENDDESFDLVDDRTIEPNEDCRLMLLPDQKLPIPAPSQITIDVFFVGFTAPLQTTMPLAAHQNAPAEGSYRFPAHGEDLPPGHYWSARSSGAGSHHRGAPSQFYAYDTGVVRWDDDEGDWVQLHPDAFGAFNEDYLIWEQPIYAMADGVVKDFENNQPDNPAPGVKLGLPSNFFTIDHGNGEISRYFHLREGSLNQDLLTVGATVEKGQFLGLAGNSGSSTAPHLHVDVIKNGVSMPLLFNEAFLIDRSLLGEPPDLDAPFTAVNDQGPPWEACIIWPSPFLRKNHEDTNGAISDVAITQLMSTRAVTAARSAAGNLELVSWQIDGDGHVASLHEEVAGPASEIAVARPGVFTNVVTAFRDSGGNLELILWDITVTGEFVRMDEHSAGPVSKVAVTPLPNNDGVVTAFRSGDGDLELIAWETAGGVITRKGEATAEAVTDVAIATITSPFEGVVTAARNSAGDLVLTSWEVTAAGNFIRRGDASAGAITKLALTAVTVASNQEHMVTAVSLSNDALKLIDWEITATGQIIRRGDVAAGTISEVAVAADGPSQIVTAVRTGGLLKLIGWEVSPTGEFEREGELSAGAVSKVALPRTLSSSGKKFALPAVRDGEGDLRVISVQSNLMP